MRIVSPIALIALLVAACDTAPRPALRAADPTTPPAAPHLPARLPHFEPTATAPAAPAPVTFAPATDLGEASCFSVVDLPDAAGELALVSHGDRGALELLAIHAGTIASREAIAPADDTHRRVSACALSLDAKGAPEAVVAWTLATRAETVAFHRGADGAWSASPIAPFAAAQIALNAKSPRGPEVVLVDTFATSLHAIRSGDAWVPMPLPPAALADAGALAVAVTADAAGRSHFALGADYYGDRDGQYVFWPGDQPRNDQPDGGLAIVLDPADPAALPQIVHAQREAVPGLAGAFATSLYRTVIGPDAARTTLWSAALAATGAADQLAPAPAQLAARLDADGYLHTIAAVRHDRGAATRWSLAYTHDRAGAPSTTDLADVRATGPVAFAGDDGLFASDHDRLVRAARTSTFPKAEPAPVAEAPSAGAVDACPAGFAAEPETLRHMSDLAAVAFATSSDDALRAVEWDLGRGAVRATSGDALGWDTQQIAPWQLDTMGAGRSRAFVDADGRTIVAWPEADGLAVWTASADGWSRSTPPIADVTATPDLATFDGTTWLAATHTDDDALELVATRATADGWTAAEVIATAPAAHAIAATFVEGAAAPTVLFADPASSALRLATRLPQGWAVRDLPYAAAAAVRAIRAVATDHDIVAVLAAADADASPPATIVAVRLDPTTPTGPALRELSRWTSHGPLGDKALHAGLAAGDPLLAWNDGNALVSVRIDADDLATARLAASPGAVLMTGFATPAGRLVLVEARAHSVDVIGQACAR